MNSGKLVTDTINWYLENLGEPVTDEHYKARIDVCNGCPYLGDVNVAGVTLKGCTQCGCPSETKPKIKHYFNPRRFKKVTVECPIKKWEDVDHLYNLNN